MPKKTITIDVEDFWPEYFLFHVPSRKVWDKLLEILGEDVDLKPCEDKLYYYEVSVNEQKR